MSKRWLLTEIFSYMVILFRNGASTVVTAIFGGILQNEVNCLICGTESRKFDPFLGKILCGMWIYNILLK